MSRTQHDTCDYARMAAAIRYLDAHRRCQPDLAELAAVTGLSPAHFQRVFSRWAGVSPKRYLQQLTLSAAKAGLLDGGNVLDASLEAGLSGTARLHDHFVKLEAVTPGEYARAGGGLTVRHGIHPSPFGSMLVGVTDRGVCALAFVDQDAGDAAAHDFLARAWPAARLARDAGGTREIAARMFAADDSESAPVSVLVRGTNFQVQVWRALLRIPAGRLVTYGALAGALGRPGAARAVGQAVGGNAIAWLIPCHRVVRATGVPGDYRWGAERKRAMIAWERARQAVTESS